MEKRIRIGLVGLKFGHFHVRTLVQEPDVEIVALADRDAAAPPVARSRALVPGARFFTSGEDLIALDGLDAVGLATSPGRRAPLLRAALARGLPVFIEKPWAADLASARALATEVEAAQGRVMVGFSFRFHPAIVKLRALLAGALGPPWMLNGEYAFECPVPADAWLWSPTSGGGFFNENSCHLFDAVCSLAGEPVAVAAQVANPRSAPGPELAAVTLRFASGAVAALTLGAAAAGPLLDFPRLDVVTAQGQARLRGRHHIWESLDWALRAGGDVHRFTQSSEVLGNTRYTAAWRHFLDAIRRDEPFAATPADGVRAVALASALLQSARTQTFVNLPLP